MVFFIVFLNLITLWINYNFIFSVDKNLFYIINIIFLFITLAFIIISLKQKQNKIKYFKEIDELFSCQSEFSFAKLKENLIQAKNKQNQEKEQLNKKISFLKQDIENIINTLTNTSHEYNTKLIEILKLKYNICDYKNEDILFDKLSIGIINDDNLENFLIKNVFSNIGIEVNLYNNSNIQKHHDLTLTKQQINKDNYFFVKDFSSVNLEKIVTYLKENFSYKQKQTHYNVLIFKANNFDNILFLNMLNQYCTHSISIDNLSEFKQYLNDEIKLIILDFEVIKHDFNAMKKILIAYKNKYNQTKIVIFTKERTKECDFADEILQDLSKNDLKELLNKYLF